MKRKQMQWYLLLGFLCFSIFNHAQQQLEKAWTIFIYIAADNDLSPYAQLNIAQAMQNGSTNEVNIVVYLAQKTAGVKTGKLLYIEKNKVTLLYTEFNVDSGSRETFSKTCTYVCQQFPSLHFAIIGWDHGTGPLNRTFKGVAYDFSTGHYLNDVDVYGALKDVYELTGKKIDILAFDACLMAGIELQAIYAPFVKYYVASQETIPGAGWDYQKALYHITSATTPQELAQQWVEAYKQTYNGKISDYTLSAVDLEKAVELAQTIHAIGGELIHLLKTQVHNSVTKYLLKASHIARNTCFDEPDYDYLDWDNFATNLLEFLPMCIIRVEDQESTRKLENFKNLLQRSKVLRSEAIIAQAVGSDYPHAGGISIYWPHTNVHPSYNKLLWTQSYPAWLESITLFLKYRFH